MIDWHNKEERERYERTRDAHVEASRAFRRMLIAERKQSLLRKGWALAYSKRLQIYAGLH
jgi:hypothetical protein